MPTRRLWVCRPGSARRVYLNASSRKAKQSLCLGFCQFSAVFQSRLRAYVVHVDRPFLPSALEGSYNKIFDAEMLHY